MHNTPYKRFIKIYIIYVLTIPEYAKPIRFENFPNLLRSNFTMCPLLDLQLSESNQNFYSTNVYTLF